MLDLLPQLVIRHRGPKGRSRDLVGAGSAS
jgi:hypothetical protein